jgi:hypothetical protein
MFFCEMMIFHMYQAMMFFYLDQSLKLDILLLVKGKCYTQKTGVMTICSLAVEK